MKAAKTASSALVPTLAMATTGPLRALPPQLAHLMLFRRFVVWDPDERNPRTGKQIKSPRQAANPNWSASVRRPETWASWDEVLRAQETNPSLRVGYVLREDTQHAFLDLDGCRDPLTGQIAEWASGILQRAQSYTEITPSGTGLRIIGLMPEGSASVMSVVPAHMLPGGPPAPEGPRDPTAKSPQIEAYFNTARYVTVTGWQLDGAQQWGLVDISVQVLELASLVPPIAERVRNPDVELPDADLTVCAVAVSNPPLGQLDTWETWNTCGMAIWAASGGSAHGLACFLYWSGKNPKHVESECLDRWDHWHHSSPPTEIGGGSLIHYGQMEAARRGTELLRPSRTTPPGGWPPLEQETSAPWALPAPEQAFVSTPDPLTGEMIPRLTVEIPAFAPPVPAKPAEPLFEFRSPTEMMDHYGEKPAFLIDDTLTRGSTLLLTGLPGAGKSPLAQDLIVRVAMGAGWCGHAGPQGHAIYLAIESARQTTLNLAGFACGVIEEAMGVEPGTVPIDVGLKEIENNILVLDNNLTLEADTDRLIRSIEGLLSEGGRWASHEPDLLVLDTLRAMSSGSVSSDEDMQVVQAALAKIKARWPDIVVLLIHHAPKGAPDGSSGSNRLDGMAETIVSMTMLPAGQGTECDKMLQRSDQWGPGVSGWYYSAFKLTMGRNKTWEKIPPVRCLMAVQGSTVRLCYDGRNTAIAGAAQVALAAAGGVFRDERKGAKPSKTMTIGTPVAPAAHEGDDGAFAGENTQLVSVEAPLRAKNAGAAAVELKIRGHLSKAAGWISTVEIRTWLKAEDDLDDEMRTAAGVNSGSRGNEQVLSRLKKLEKNAWVKSQAVHGGRGLLEWRAT